MCQHCEGETPLESEIMSIEVVRWHGTTPALLVNFAAPDSYSDVNDMVVKINFCPMCGQSLTKLAPDNASLYAPDDTTGAFDNSIIGSLP